MKTKFRLSFEFEVDDDVRFVKTRVMHMLVSALAAPGACDASGYKLAKSFREGICRGLTIHEVIEDDAVIDDDEFFEAMKDLFTIEPGNSPERRKAIARAEELLNSRK